MGAYSIKGYILFIKYLNNILKPNMILLIIAVPNVVIHQIRKKS